MSLRLGWIDESLVERIRGILRRASLPIEPPPQVSIDQFRSLMAVRREPCTAQVHSHAASNKLTVLLTPVLLALFTLRLSPCGMQCVPQASPSVCPSLLSPFLPVCVMFPSSPLLFLGFLWCLPGRWTRRSRMGSCASSSSRAPSGAVSSLETLIPQPSRPLCSTSASDDDLDSHSGGEKQEQEGFFGAHCDWCYLQRHVIVVVMSMLFRQPSSSSAKRSIGRTIQFRNTCQAPDSALGRLGLQSPDWHCQVRTTKACGLACGERKEVTLGQRAQYLNLSSRKDVFGRIRTCAGGAHKISSLAQ